MTGKYKTGLALLLVLLFFVPSVCTASAESSAYSDDNMTTITKNVYVYGYPLVLVDITRGQMTATSRPDMTKAPVNQFLRAMKTPTALFTGIVSPNVDTLYSNAFLDLSDEPVVLSVPDTNGRYYLMPLIDSWSNVFASPGKRTTGTEAGNFLISGPGWQGTIPDGTTEIKAPTNAVWLLGRTLVNSTDPDDMAAVRTIQEEYMLTPLSAWGTDYTPPVGVFVDPSVDKITPPVDQVADMTPEQFYNRLSRLLKDNPPPETDASMVQEMAELGIGSDMSFEWNSTDPEIRNALTQGAAAGLAEIVRTAKASDTSSASTNNWHIMNYGGSYGTRYLERAAFAWALLGANLPDDSVYSQVRTDSEMLPLDGNNQYIIHFAANTTPPVSGFWSITLYNNQHFLVDNAIDRYAVGDRTPMKYNADGSLDIYIQNDSPGEEQESNWLPAPCEGFNLYLRQYWPSEDIMTKTWIPPAVVQVSKIQAESSAIPAAQSSLPLGFALIGAGIAFILILRRK